MRKKHGEGNFSFDTKKLTDNKKEKLNMTY